MIFCCSYCQGCTLLSFVVRLPDSRLTRRLPAHWLVVTPETRREESYGLIGSLWFEQQPVGLHKTMMGVLFAVVNLPSACRQLPSDIAEVCVVQGALVGHGPLLVQLTP